jgi:hypothetical protein
VVERDSPLLSLRVAAFAVVGAAVGTWFVVAPHVGAVSLWTAIAVVAGGVLPGTLLLVFLVLPLWSRPWQAAVAVALVLALVALGCSVEGWALAANFAKLWAAVFAGWAFLQLFAELAWVVVVAVVVAIVDAISVYSSAGPTHEIVTHHIQIYNDVAVAFLAPHEGAAQLGPPDILFYALFLAAAARWRLRPGWTWIATTGMYSVTLVIANAANLNGVPALPFLSFGFLLANADLLWRRLRPAR